MIKLWTFYKQVKAFNRTFKDKDGKMKPEAKAVIAYLRDECCGKGELLGDDGSSFLYGPDGRFDAGAAGFYLGKRRVFDLVIRLLALDEIEVFNYASLKEGTREQTLEDNINKI